MRALGKAALGVLAACLLLEVVARLHDLVRYHWGGSGSVGAYQEVVYAAYPAEQRAAVTASTDDRRRLRFDPHPFLLYAPRPSQSLSTIHINARGLRGPEWRSGAEVRHIVVLGGSAVYGSGALDDARTIPGYLGQLIREQYPSRSIEVINAGVDGYTSTQERILLEERLLEVADCVVIFDGINDIYSATVFDGDRVGFPAEFAEYEQRIRHPVASSLHRFLIRSMAYEKVGRRLGVLAGRARRRSRGPQALEEDLQRMRDHYVRNLRLLRAVTKGRRVPMLVCLQPTILRDRKALAPSERLIRQREAAWGYKVDDPVWLMERAYALLLAEAPALAREGIQFVDFSDVFSEQQEAIYIDPVHFSDRGHRLVAQRIFGLLRPVLMQAL